MRDDNWKRQLVLGVSMLVVIGLLVGGIVAFVSLKAADVAGITDDDPDSTAATSAPASTPSAPPASTTPTEPTSSTTPTTPTTTSTTPAPTVTTTTVTETTSAPTTSSSTTRSEPSTPTDTDGGFTMSASRSSAGSYQRVQLTGRFTGSGSLTLQRRVDGGAWEDFPAEVARSGPRFTTYIESGRSGLNEFRVVARAGLASPVVSVRIR